MTTQQNNEWGDIPQGWEVVALGDIAEIITGSTPSTLNAEFWNGDIAWITPTDIGENKDIYFGERNISKKGLKSIRELPKNTLLVTCIASIGKNAILRNLGACNQQINAIIPSNNFNIDFLYYFFENNKMELRNMAGITATPIISKALFSNFQITLPPKPEQTAIATVLSDTDKWIDSLTALIAKKQAIKSATMSQLLSGQKRLPQFANHSDGTPKTYIQTDNGKIPEDWEVVALGDLANLYQPETISSSQLQISGYPVYGANGIIGFYKNYNHEEPQVMVTCRGSTCGTVNMSVAYSWITGNAMVVNPNDRISKKFMYYLLSYQDLSTCITGSGQPQIVRTPLANFKVKIPKSPTEQTAITQILSDMDSDIIALEHRLTKARALKQGLMHQLLTGKIRLFSGSLNN